MWTLGIRETAFQILHSVILGVGLRMAGEIEMLWSEMRLRCYGVLTQCLVWNAGAMLDSVSEQRWSLIFCKMM